MFKVYCCCDTLTHLLTLIANKEISVVALILAFLLIIIILLFERKASLWLKSVGFS